MLHTTIQWAALIICISCLIHCSCWGKPINGTKNLFLHLILQCALRTHKLYKLKARKLDFLHFLHDVCTRLGGAITWGATHRPSSCAGSPDVHKYLPLPHNVCSYLSSPSLPPPLLHCPPSVQSSPSKKSRHYRPAGDESSTSYSPSSECVSTILDPVPLSTDTFWFPLCPIFLFPFSPCCHSVIVWVHLSVTSVMFSV